MILVIDNNLYDVEPPVLEGTVIDPGMALALRELWLSRCLARWGTWMKQNPTATPATSRSAFVSIVQAFKFDKPDKDGDVVVQEALALARTLVENRLTARGLPIPKNLDEHVQALASSPEIVQRARVIVQAKLDVNQKILAENVS